MLLSENWFHCLEFIRNYITRKSVVRVAILSLLLEQEMVELSVGFANYSFDIYWSEIRISCPLVTGLLSELLEFCQMRLQWECAVYLYFYLLLD